jgi:hypothetical protein
MAFGLSNTEEKKLRIERLVALLNQSNDLLIGLGQYVGDKDSNRKVMEEVIASNRVVIDQELDTMHIEESRIITRL